MRGIKCEKKRSIQVRSDNDYGFDFVHASKWYCLRSERYEEGCVDERILFSEYALSGERKADGRSLRRFTLKGFHGPNYTCHFRESLHE